MDARSHELKMERCTTSATALVPNSITNKITAISELSVGSHKSLAKEGKHIDAVPQRIEQVMPFSTHFTANHSGITQIIS